MSVTLRSSGASVPNPKIEDCTERDKRLSNRSWLERRPEHLRNAVLLIGGTRMAHFRLRCAQAVMRRDLLPSFWSQVGLITADDYVLTVPVDSLTDVSRVPDANGVEQMPLGAFSDLHCYPNIALIRFTQDMGELVACAKAVSPHREQLSVPALVVRWLAYIWALNDERNPLSEGIGIPSARWLETVFAAGSVELAPGLATGASCPEAVWQAARWWHEFYEQVEGANESALGRRGTISPTGLYVVRQYAAALLGPRDTVKGTPKDDGRTSREFNPL